MELETLEAMLRIYCRDTHGGGDICDGCRELLLYAAGRLAKCPYSPKPACKNCSTHCFSAENRERIRAVMRHSGPRMPLAHPILAFRHYFR